jgi:tetratricopeptide (TPR) repeat protein
MSPIKKPTEKVVLSSVVESLKKKANVAFEKKKYSNAIHLYNEAIQLCPDSSVLYGNRSAALFYRAWYDKQFVISCFLLLLSIRFISKLINNQGTEIYMLH